MTIKDLLKVLDDDFQSPVVIRVLDVDYTYQSLMNKHILHGREIHLIKVRTLTSEATVEDIVISKEDLEYNVHMPANIFIQQVVITIELK